MSSHSPSPGPGGPRKSHCCRTCGMPMKGHQRGACVPNNFMHSPASSPLMPPPDTFPSGPSHSNPCFSSPNARPIMPGAYAGERPSEISVPAGLSAPLPTRSLRDRIGAKIEEETSFIPHYSEEIYDPHYGKHATAPVHGYAGRTFGGSASGYAASASGSMYGSSSTVLMPEHSVSQRFIRRDRAVSDGTNPLSGRLADRLGGYSSDDFIGPDNGDFFDDEGSFEYDDSFDNDGDESDPAYPSDGSAMGGGASASYYASESEAGTYTTTGHSSAPSFGALMRGSGAAPLYTVYEVASKYVHLLRDRAKRKGFSVRVIPTDNDDEVDDFGRRKWSSREPGNVRILLGRDEDALREVERQHRSGVAMHIPVKQLRIRGRPSSSEQRHSSPQMPPPPHQGSPYPPPQLGLPYAPAPATVAHVPHQQPSWLGSLCVTVTATVVAIIVLLFAGLGFWVVLLRSSE